MIASMKQLGLSAEKDKNKEAAAAAEDNRDHMRKLRNWSLQLKR